MKFLLEALEELESVDNVIKLDKSEVACATLLTLQQAKEVEVNNRDFLRASRWWWLRSTDNYSSCASTVRDFGEVYSEGLIVDSIWVFVRPALILKNLESLNIEIGGLCEINGTEFIHVLPGVILAKDVVGECPFRTKGNCIKMSDCKVDEYWTEEDKPYNDYETSDIKKFVDDWFANL